MATDLPQAEPSDELRHRLRRSVEETEQLAAPARVVEPAPATVSTIGSARGSAEGGRRRWLPALAAAAVAAVVGLGVWNVVLTEDRQDLRSTVASQSEVMEALLDPHRATLSPLGDDGEPIATVVPRDGELEVVTHGLAPNDAERTTYVVWGLQGGQPVPLGTFDVQDPQMEMQTVGSGLTGLDQYDEYAVSLEPGQEAPSAPTDVVATGQVTS
jgi:hypothetical protein